MGRSVSTSNATFSTATVSETVLAGDFLAQVSTGEVYVANDPTSDVAALRPLLQVAGDGKALVNTAIPYTAGNGVVVATPAMSQGHVVLSNGNIALFHPCLDGTTGFATAVYTPAGVVVSPSTTVPDTYSLTPGAGIIALPAGGFIFYGTDTSGNRAFTIFSNAGAVTQAKTILSGFPVTAAFVRACLLSNGNLAFSVQLASSVGMAIYTQAGAVVLAYATTAGWVGTAQTNNKVQDMCALSGGGFVISRHESAAAMAYSVFTNAGGVTKARTVLAVVGTGAISSADAHYTLPLSGGGFAVFDGGANSTGTGAAAAFFDAAGNQQGVVCAMTISNACGSVSSVAVGPSGSIFVAFVLDAATITVHKLAAAATSADSKLNTINLTGVGSLVDGNTTSITVHTGNQISVAVCTSTSLGIAWLDMSKPASQNKTTWQVIGGTFGSDSHVTAIASTATAAYLPSVLLLENGSSIASMLWQFRQSVSRAATPAGVAIDGATAGGTATVIQTGLATLRTTWGAFYTKNQGYSIRVSGKNVSLAQVTGSTQIN